MNKRYAIGLSALAAAFITAPVQAEIVIIVSAQSTLGPPLGQVCQAFLGKIKTPTPINLTEKNPLRDAFYATACKKDPAQVQSIWGKLLFTGTGTPPAEVENSSAMKKAIAANSNAIGYIEKKDADTSVRIIATVN